MNFSTVQHSIFELRVVVHIELLKQQWCNTLLWQINNSDVTHYYDKSGVTHYYDNSDVTHYYDNGDVTHYYDNSDVTHYYDKFENL